VVVVLFPLYAEARPFLKKLRARAVPVVFRRDGFTGYRFEIDGRQVEVIIIGTGETVRALPATGLVPSGAAVVLAGSAKALNPRLHIGDILAVASVKKEGGEGTIALRLLEALSLPAASLVTCDRVVHRSEESADLADMEGYYAAALFPDLMILRAVSDRDEDLTFLNRCIRNGQLRRRALVRCLTPRRIRTLVRFKRNLDRACQELAAVLWDCVVVPKRVGRDSLDADAAAGRLLKKPL
jgi:hypothetical protein